MMRTFKKLISSLLFCLILGLVLGFFLLKTTAGLQLLVKLGSLALPGTLKVHHLKGSVLNQLEADEIEYEVQGVLLHFKKIKAQWQFEDYSKLLLKRLTVNSLNFSSFELTDLQLVGELSTKLLQIQSLQAQYGTQLLKGQGHMDLQAPYALQAQIKLDPDSKHLNSLSGVFSLSGALNQLQWTASFKGPGRFRLKGKLNNLSELQQSLEWHDFQYEQQQSPLFYSAAGKMDLSGTLPEVALNLQAQVKGVNKDLWQLKTQLHGRLPWTWQLEAQLVPLALAEEGLKAQLSLSAKMKSSKEGELKLRLHPGFYKLPAHSSLSKLSFQGGLVHLLLTTKQLTGSASIQLEGAKKIKAKLELPDFELTQGLIPKQRLHAQLTLISSLDFLKELSPEITNTKGELTAEIEAAGQWEKPSITSSLRLNRAALDLPGLGLHLTDFEFLGKGKKGAWEASGSLNSEQKKLSLVGKGQLDKSLSGTLWFSGTEVPVVNTKEYLVKISPQVQVHFQDSNLNIQGKIGVPFAQLNPQSFANSLSLPEDVVFQKTSQKTSPSLFNTKMDVQVEMGEQVSLKFKGLDALLTGTVHLTQLPQGPVNASGELTVKKGKYQAYGQNLSIKQGQLIFTGGRVDNPGIDLRASRKVDTGALSSTQSAQALDPKAMDIDNQLFKGTVEVGVEVTGRIKNPRILLFSNPALLSQADILSMLVLGVPASRANKAGGQLLLAAISSMNLDRGSSGEQLLDQLKKYAAFDLNIQTNTNYDAATQQTTDSTSIVLGKALSKKIYVSYNMGLSQANPNVLTLKYLLNRFYSIQISSSMVSSGIDVLYTSHKKES